MRKTYSVILGYIFRLLARQKNRDVRPIEEYEIPPKLQKDFISG